MVATQITGLKVRGKNWHFRKQINGVRIDQSLGNTSQVTMADAVQAAEALERRVRGQGAFGYRLAKAQTPNLGHNSDITLREVAYELCEFGKLHGTKKTSSRAWKSSTLKNWEKWFSYASLAELINMPISLIQSQDVVDWYVMDLKRGKPTQTDNMFRMLIRAAKWAVGEGYIKLNFTDQMKESEKRYVVRKREGRLSMSGGATPRNELGTFVYSLVTTRPEKLATKTAIHLIMLLILTGRRRSELSNMQWDWINFEDNVITIPAESSSHPKSNFLGTKNRKPFVLPMCRLVQSMMQFRRERDTGSDFVFPGRSGDRPILDFRKTVAKIMDDAGIIESRMIHDLRRTFSSIVQRVEGDFFVTKEAMGHSANDVTMDYLGGLTMNEKKLTFQRVSDFVSQTMPLKVRVAGVEHNYSGTEKLSNDNRTITEDYGWSQDGAEWNLFDGKVWRDGAWHQLYLTDVADGIEKAAPEI